MAQTQSRNQKRGIIAVFVAVAGIAVGVGMGIKAHEFYNTMGLHFDLEGPQSSFEIQPGRYELTYKQELGRLTFEIVSPTGQPVEVKDFDWVTQLFHTQGWRGHAFVIDQPGAIQVTVKPWPSGATGSRVNLSSTDTEAIARWSGGEMLLSGLSCAVAMMIFLPVLQAKKKAAAEPDTTADTKAN
jgi:hypothetical protein